VFSFSSLCLFITNKCKNKQDYENFSQASLGRFKANYPKLNGILKNELDHDLLIATFLGDFSTLIDSIEYDKIRGSIFKLATNLIEFNPNFGKKGLLSIYQTKTIDLAIVHAKEAFNKQNSNEIEIFSDPFLEITSQLSPSINIIEATVFENNDSNDNNTNNTNFNSNENSNTTSTSSNLNINNLDDDSLYKKIRFAYRRLVRKENNVNINQFHYDNKTVPKMLYAKSWPVPMLAHNEKFMMEFNDLIFKNTAPNILKLNIKYENQSIEALRMNIDEYKSKIRNKSDINSKINQIIEEENLQAGSYITKSINKARATSVRQFLVKPKTKTHTIKNLNDLDNNKASKRTKSTISTSTTNDTTSITTTTSPTNNTHIINNNIAKTPSSTTNISNKSNISSLINKINTNTYRNINNTNKNQVNNIKNIYHSKSKKFIKHNNYEHRDNKHKDLDTDKLFTMFQSLINQLKPIQSKNNNNYYKRIRNNNYNNRFDYNNRKNNHNFNNNLTYNNNSNFQPTPVRQEIKLQNAPTILPLMSHNFDYTHQNNQLHQQQVQQQVQQQLQQQQLQQQYLPQQVQNYQLQYHHQNQSSSNSSGRTIF
jgi:hypothetical protein